jgi:uncharacterized protein (TIGR03118 family)
MRGALFLAVATGLAGVSCDPGSDDTDAASTQTEELRIKTADRVVQVVTQENLVSDQAGVAKKTDPNLVNAWGLAFSPTGPAWVSSAEKGRSEVFDDDGNLLRSVVIPPPPGGDESNPTGQVFNDIEGAFDGDRFIFVTENGTIAGWQPSNGGTAVIRVDRSSRGAIFKGVAISRVDGRTRLFATDFHNNRLWVFDENYKPVFSGGGRYEDPELPANYAPFNVATRGRFLFVTYAQQDAKAEDDVAGGGHGFLDVFTADGRNHLRLASRGPLNSPWGMAFMPAGDDFTVRLLVGNFGDGRIHVYRLGIGDDFKMNAKLEGALGDRPDHPIVIDGLWALEFGLGKGGFDKDDLYFTAGPADESHGLFGELSFAH